MKRTNKKGFTIVELVIVIAVIAILAAVLIPTFVRLVRKSKINTDTQLIRNLNTALEADKVDNTHSTMSDALEAAAKYGYDVSKINASATNNEILWDSENDVFCYFNDGEIEYLPDSVDNNKKLSAESNKLWKIYNGEVPSIENQTYSIYLGSATAANSINNGKVKVGLDMGNQSVDAITYEHSGTAQTVVIRTNGGTLTIDAPNDTVKHYGEAAVLNIETIKTTSYHEFGTIGNAQIKTGRIVIESAEAKIENLLLIAKSDKSGFEEIIVETKLGASFPVFDRTDVIIASTGTKVVEVKTPATDDFIYLTKAGVIEQIVVADTGTADVSGQAGNVANQTASTQTAAEQIANVGKKNNDGQYVDSGNNVIEIEDLTSTSQIVVEQKADDSKVSIGLSLFSGGVGTENSPFLVSTIEDLSNVGTNSSIGWLGGYTYSLVSDLTINNKDIRGHKAENMGSSAHSDIAVYMDDGTVFYGNNHTIVVNTDDLFIFHGPEGNSSKTAILKDLNVVLNGTNLGLCAYAKKCVIENITISGDVVWTGDNMGIVAASIYDDAGNAQVITLKNITNNCNIRVEGGSTRYDGLFIGQIQQTKKGNNAPTIEFINCTNNGTVVGQQISMFVGNPWGTGDLKLVTENVVNNGTIRAMNNEYYANIYYATPSNLADQNRDLYINGTAYKCANVPSFSDIYTDTNIINLGVITQTSVDPDLALTVNNDKSLAITPSQNASITKYVVYLGLYTTGYNADGTTNGSGRFYVSEEIPVADLGNGVSLKNYGFVDQIWLNAHPGAVPGTLSGNAIYTLGDDVYYMIDNSYYAGHAGFGFGGNVKYATMISVVAYDGDNIIVCTTIAQLE